MSNKKIKIIIFGIIILFSSFVLIFIFKDRIRGIISNDNTNDVVVPSVEKAEPGKETTTAPISSDIISENVNIQKAKEAERAKFLAELKDNHPEYSTTQLEFYDATAAEGKMVPCLGRDDEGDCVAAVAFVSRAHIFCGEIKDEKAQIECSNAILAAEAETEINRCFSKSEYLRVQCLTNIFQVYKQPEDCVDLGEKIRPVCTDVVYYKIATQQDDQELCDKIIDGYLKSYCFKNVGVSANIDTDGDGLSDDEELNKYHTDPKDPDSDNDGYKDGDEIRNGFDPKGPGKLIAN